MATQHHAADMAARNYYAHRSPEGSTVADRDVAAGNDSGLVAENIAHCEGCPLANGPATIERLERGWMNRSNEQMSLLRTAAPHHAPVTATRCRSARR
jgi:uncharacterized protein YkwD